ncbi:MAG: hypothetical protein HON90_09055 [Halobacteriovoraceae bacterium]|jgi:hypothetical protein|nr:hypothetical protein [Halobacteriovoraceae bacterium]
MFKTILSCTFFILMTQSSLAQVEQSEVYELDFTMKQESEFSQLDISILKDMGLIKTEEWTRPAHMGETIFMPVDEGYGDQFKPRLFKVSKKYGLRVVPVMNRHGDFRIQFSRYKLPLE